MGDQTPVTSTQVGVVQGFFRGTPRPLDSTWLVSQDVSVNKLFGCVHMS